MKVGLSIKNNDLGGIKMQIPHDGNNSINQLNSKLNKDNILEKVDNQTIIDGQIDKNINLSKEEIEENLEQLNEAVEAVNKNFRFELHEESDRMMVKIIDSKKGEVIKEIPPKETLDMLGRIKEMVGIIIDEKI
jgi:flagellar protein FlaG